MPRIARAAAAAALALALGLSTAAAQFTPGGGRVGPPGPQGPAGVQGPQGPAGTNQAFGGRVKFDGTAIMLPAGWTSSRTGNGTYLVTHNLGTNRYAVTATGMQATFASTFRVDPATALAASFVVLQLNPSSQPQDGDFNFVLTTVPGGAELAPP